MSTKTIEPSKPVTAVVNKDYGPMPVHTVVQRAQAMEGTGTRFGWTLTPTSKGSATEEVTVRFTNGTTATLERQQLYNLTGRAEKFRVAAEENQQSYLHYLETVEMVTKLMATLPEPPVTPSTES